MCQLSIILPWSGDTDFLFRGCVKNGFFWWELRSLFIVRSQSEAVSSWQKIALRMAMITGDGDSASTLKNHDSARNCFDSYAALNGMESLMNTARDTFCNEVFFQKNIFHSATWRNWGASTCRSMGLREDWQSWEKWEGITPSLQSVRSAHLAMSHAAAHLPSHYPQNLPYIYRKKKAKWTARSSLPSSAPSAANNCFGIAYISLSNTLPCHAMTLCNCLCDTYYASPCSDLFLPCSDLFLPCSDLFCPAVTFHSPCSDLSLTLPSLNKYSTSTVPCNM